MDHACSLIKSTITCKFNSTGTKFASTHGDHTVKIWEWPSGRLLRVLEGHWRTPWAVQWHPLHENLVASGCLGCEVILWDVGCDDRADGNGVGNEQVGGKVLNRFRFPKSVSCVAFHPSGRTLAITSGWCLYVWDIMEKDVAPVLADSAKQAFHFVDFDPRGIFLIVGQKNMERDVLASELTAQREATSRPAFTLKLNVYRFGVGVTKTGLMHFSIPRCVAYNDAGTHFSPCGKLFLCCIPTTRNRHDQQFQIATIAIYGYESKRRGNHIVHSLPIDSPHAAALTNLKFSATSRHVLVGFSFPASHPVLRTQALMYHKTHSQGTPPPPMSVEVVRIYRLGQGHDRSFTLVKTLSSPIEIDGAAKDEINVALFSPGNGVSDGVLIGTQKGRIRMFGGG